MSNVVEQQCGYLSGWRLASPSRQVRPSPLHLSPHQHRSQRWPSFTTSQGTTAGHLGHGATTSGEIATATITMTGVA